MQTETHVDMESLAMSLANSLSQSLQYQTPQVKESLSKLDELYQKAYDEDIAHLMVGSYSIYVDFECKGKRIKCLFDTGAQSNIMSTKLVSELNIEDHVDTTTKTEFRGVGGNPETTNGFIPYLQLEFGNYTFPTCFEVIKANMPYDCIIGILFMRTYGVCIDFDKNCMRIGNNNIPFRLADK